MARKLPPLPCTYPGCANSRRNRSVKRCHEHKGVHLPRDPDRDSDPDVIEPRPRSGMWYCTPCHRWVSNLLHPPAKLAAPARARMAAASQPATV